MLETTFHTDDGVVRLTDCMPIRGRTVDIVRLVEGISGRVPMHMDLTIRFDYGSIVPWVGQADDGILSAVAGPDAICLNTPVHTHGAGKATVADFVVEAGEQVPFVLAYHASHQPAPRFADASARGEGDRELVAPLGEAVHLRRSVERRRDAFAHHAQGADVRADRRDRRRTHHVAARVDRQRAQLGLPLLLAARRQPHAVVAHRRRLHDEALAWRDWLLRAAAGDPEDLQIMYGPAGERRLTEYTVDWLDGYESSAPVRVGNAASEQFQLDVYGEVLATLYQTRKLIPDGNGHRDSWGLELALLARAREPLAPSGRGHLGGAWPAPALHALEGDGVARRSTAPCRDVEEFDLEGPVERWRTIRDEIHATDLQRGLRRRARRVHPVVRIEEARRRGAHDADDRLPARHRRTGDRNGQRDRTAR